MDTEPMKIIFGPRLDQVLGISDGKPENEMEPVDPKQLEELQMRVEQAIAASSLSDMDFPVKLIRSSAKERRYIVRLKFKWQWPVPVRLELRVIDEETWKLEFVESKGNKS